MNTQSSEKTLSSNEDKDEDGSETILIIGWIRENIANKIGIVTVIKQNIDKIICGYYKQLKVILAPDALKDWIKNTGRNEEKKPVMIDDEDVYFALLTVYGYCRFIMKFEIIDDICYVIEGFYYSPILNNGQLFQSWANILATTGGVVIGYSKGRPYYNPPQTIDPFMMQYEQYMNLSSQAHITNANCRIIGGYWIEDEYEYKYPITYASFTDLYWDQMAYEEPVDKLNEICTRYDQYKYSIFIESQDIAFTYYRLAHIVFDIIWSLMWCV